jgi:hypothetical protein
MCGTGIGSVIAIALFHAGAVYDKPPGAGGGGGIFYTGADREHRWDCSACHRDAAGQIRITVTVQPSVLTDTGRYTPGQRYHMIVKLEGEHLGMQSETANYNGFALGVFDQSGKQAGLISGYAPDEIYAGGDAIVANAGQKPAETQWEFDWNAPAAGTGRVTLSVGGVDGNGGGVMGGTQTDPWGDDVFIGGLTFDDGSMAARSHGLVWAAALAFVVLFRRRMVPLLICLSLAACDASTKPDPCPHGICTGPGSGGCVEQWTCTPWSVNGSTATRNCSDDHMCGTIVNKPPVGPLPLPALDLDYYKCNVEPILDRGCGMLGCHGTEFGRALRIYSRGRLRNNEMVNQVSTCPIGPQIVNLQTDGTGTIMCVGWSPHTQTEWQKNYDSARAFMLGLTNPDDSDLLAQPVVGGKAHTGVHLFTKTSPEYQTIRAWLSGQALGMTCNPGAN